jgi:hypothetical protein
LANVLETEGALDSLLKGDPVVEALGAKELLLALGARLGSGVGSNGSPCVGKLVTIVTVGPKVGTAVASVGEALGEPLWATVGASVADIDGMIRLGDVVGETVARVGSAVAAVGENVGTDVASVGEKLGNALWAAVGAIV